MSRCIATNPPIFIPAEAPFVALEIVSPELSEFGLRFTAAELFGPR